MRLAAKMGLMFIIFFCPLQESEVKKKTVYFLYNESGDEIEVNERSSDILAFHIGGETFLHSIKLHINDTVLKSSVSQKLLSSILRERELELSWLDSANTSFEKENGTPHPYSLVRNIDSFYDNIYLIKPIEECCYLRTEVIWTNELE